MMRGLLFGVGLSFVVGCSASPGGQTGSGQGGLAGLGGPTDDGASTTPGATTGGGTPCQGQGIKVMAGCTAPAGTYVALNDKAETDRIAQEMWTVMTNAQCWYMDNSAQQYIFYGQLQYTFWGTYSDSKSGGTLEVTSIGRYENKNAATVTMRSETWMITIGDASTIYLGKVLNGQPYVETYRAHNDGRCT